MSGAARVHGRLESRASAVLSAELVGFRGGPVATVTMVAIAWATLLALDATGAAAALHHHALIEGGPPLMVAVALFLLAWQVMIAAMMVPSSMPAIRNVIGVATGPDRKGRVEVAFLVGFFLVWAGFGLLAFLGDMVVHRTVDSAPWLASRPWLIEAGALALAGGYQFLPRKRRYLERCRRPGDHARATVGTLGQAVRLGLDHGIACLGASWALMLLMFGEGFGGVVWMVALTAVMILETYLPSPRRLTALVGIGLILLSLSTLSGPSFS